MQVNIFEILNESVLNTFIYFVRSHRGIQEELTLSCDNDHECEKLGCTKHTSMGFEGIVVKAKCC